MKATKKLDSQVFKKSSICCAIRCSNNLDTEDNKLIGL